MSETDTARPGEVDLESRPAPAAEPIPAAEPAAAEPAAEPVVDVVAEPVVEAKPAKPGMLEELIEHRTVRRTLERERQQLAPVLSRLTPELQQAIAEGRILVKPQPSSTDARNDQLTQMAVELRLYTQDADGKSVPDLDAAGRVDRVIRSRVNESVAPMQQSAAMTAARDNIAKAVDFAKAHGYDVESVRQHFENALTGPNGPQMVADPGVAEELWYGAVGRAASQGKGRTLPPKPAAPTAVAAEPTGRRGPASTVALSPALARVYADHGMDPTKTPSATKPPVVDASGHISLE